MTVEQGLSEVNQMLKELMHLLDRGEIDQCRELLSQAQNKLDDTINLMRIRAAFE